MDKKLLVTIDTPSQAATVHKTGARVLAEYPRALLVLASDDQQRALAEAGLEAAALEREEGVMPNDPP